MESTLKPELLGLRKMRVCFTRRVEPIPGKCDRPMIISKKRSGGYFAVRAYKVIHVSRKLIFAEMTRFRKN